jgi:succinylarginine dihydrolase
VQRLDEWCFDGLVGPTHGYAGLSHGNLASERHRGQPGNPKAAALQGLAKMQLVAELGVRQAILPPHARPDVDVLRAFGCAGSDADVLSRAQATAPELLERVSSASSMWAANSATVAPSTDTEDGLVHLAVANLGALLHRSLEARMTERSLRRIFADSAHFAVHPALPAGDYFGDEGAANHARLAAPGTEERAVDERKFVHLFTWGRDPAVPELRPPRFPRRQTRAASEAVARLNRLSPDHTVFMRQNPDAIDAGAFHSDVLMVSHGAYMLLHESAFERTGELLSELAARVGSEFRYSLATEKELSVADAVSSYPFNSQLLSRDDGSMVIVAPSEARENTAARTFLERAISEDNPLRAVHYVDVNASMKNGGGPACLRLRVQLTPTEGLALQGRVRLDSALYAELVAWVEKHYRDRLLPADLADPAFVLEVHTALDELTRLLELGSIYDFQL